MDVKPLCYRSVTVTTKIIIQYYSCVSSCSNKVLWFNEVTLTPKIKKNTPLKCGTHTLSSTNVTTMTSSLLDYIITLVIVREECNLATQFSGIDAVVSHLLRGSPFANVALSVHYQGAREGRPSRPALPVSCTYISTSSGMRQWITWHPSGQSMPMPNAMVATTMRRHDEEVNRSSILSCTDGCVDRIYMSIKWNCGKSGLPGGLVKFWPT